MTRDLVGIVTLARSTEDDQALCAATPLPIRPCGSSRLTIGADRPLVPCSLLMCIVTLFLLQTSIFVLTQRNVNKPLNVNVIFTIFF